MTQEFDPLDYANLTRHVVEELMRQPVVPKRAPCGPSCG